jgi:hypothetical protein
MKIINLKRIQILSNDMIKLSFSKKIEPHFRACKFYNNELCKKRYNLPLYIDENKIINPSDKIHNDCRNSESKCGKNGKYFIKKIQIFI